MKRYRFGSVMMAVAGCVAVVVGVHQGLVHVAPGYEGTITSGWEGALNHEEVLLGQLGVVGVGGAVAARRWKHLASVPLATGSVVLFYALRAVYGRIRSRPPLYREFSIHGAGFDGDTVMVVFGAEPFLLAAGGLLLVGSGVASESRFFGGERDEETPQPS